MTSLFYFSAILNRFYFTPEKELNYGDCSLTINPVLEEDIGQWTCAALLHDHTLESRDTISVFVGSKYCIEFMYSGFIEVLARIVAKVIIISEKCKRWNIIVK